MNPYQCPECRASDFRVIVSMTAEMDGEGRCIPLDDAEITVLEEHGVLCAECGADFNIINLTRLGGIPNTLAI